jgi:hypothetical protein
VIFKCLKSKGMTEHEIVKFLFMAMQDNRKIINYLTEYKCFNEKINKLGEITVTPLQLDKVFLAPHLMLTIKDALMQNVDFLKIVDVSI